MADAGYDLTYDPNEVGGDSLSSAGFPTVLAQMTADFDPQPADIVTVGDDEERPLRGRVVRRDGNRVWVQLELAAASHAVA